MKRVERLFKLISLMQEGNVCTSKYLSKKLGVSTRTVHRDIGDLVSSGVPIAGQSGVGFLLRGEQRLPSVNFTNDELQALALGAQMARTWADKDLGNASETAMRKLEKVLPKSLKPRIHLDAIEVHGVPMSDDDSAKLKTARASLEAREKLSVSYSSPDKTVSHRLIRPLMLSCWAGIWSLGAWCELRGEFRTFRIDRMLRVERTDETFEQSPNCNHHAYFSCPKRRRFFRDYNQSRKHDDFNQLSGSPSPRPTDTPFALRSEQH
ncbi:MAG: YafY family protein [Hyphomonas sp.]